MTPRLPSPSEFLQPKLKTAWYNAMKARPAKRCSSQAIQTAVLTTALCLSITVWINLLKPEQDDWHFTGDIFKRIFKKEALSILFPISSNSGSLQWRHNGRDGVSNHQPYECLLNRLFKRRSKKTSKRQWPLRGERVSKAENNSIWWQRNKNLERQNGLK